MLKVLHYIPGFLYGGIESMYLSWYRNIDHESVEFELLLRTQDDNAVALQQYRELNGVYYRLPPIKTPFRFIRELNFFFKVHHDYDILHVHRWDPYILVAAKRHGIKSVIIHSHSTRSNYGIKNRIFEEWEKVSIRKFADRAFACSQLAAKWKYGGMTFRGKDVTIIHNAIRAEKYDFSASKREDIRKELGLDNQLVIGHVGRFTPPKNQFYLFDIFAALLSLQDNSILLMLGDGPDAAALEDYAENLGISERVRFMGSRNDVPDLLQAMDVFLLPSRWEGMPVTLVEAQAAGLPCVISDVISEEGDVTDLVTRLSIQESPKHWAKVVLSVSGKTVRQSQRQAIADAGYDIATETVKLVGEYLDIAKETRMK